MLRESTLSSSAPHSLRLVELYGVRGREREAGGGRGREGREGDTGESKCRMGCEKCVEGGAGGNERESWSEYLVCTMAEGFRSTSSSNPTAKMSDGCSVAFNDGRRQ